MIASRDLMDLVLPVRVRAQKFISACDAAGIDLLVTSTYRDHASQDALYAQGRSKIGPIVTNARGGQSYHNFRCALDVVPMRAGKPVWDTRGTDGLLWQRVGAIGESCGLDWAGRWERFREYAHFQYTGGLTLADLQAGKTVV